MLSFDETPEVYQVTETICGFIHTSTKIVEYSKDINYKRIDGGTWRKTTVETRDWFEAYYRKHFE